MNYHHYLQKREYGIPVKYSDHDFIMKRVYQAMEPYTYWNEVHRNLIAQCEFGSIFNLEFSPEGNILVAACERKQIVVFDSLTAKQTHKLSAAHSDNINLVKFLDSRMFASCSDDMTVALWDMRYLKNKVRSLNGHTNWVKNVEYSPKDGLLVTSGFDGNIFTWDINSHTERGLIYQKVFHTSGLMRCRLSPDSTKMVFCTTGGYLMIIHDLDLKTLQKDLYGFRPNIYRLMQMGQQYIPQAAKFDHVFSKKQKKNRIELVTDFPKDDDAEVIQSLQIDPQGRSILSRNISYDEMSEWTCIHDLTEEPKDITINAKNYNKRKRKYCSSNSDGEDGGLSSCDSDVTDEFVNNSRSTSEARLHTVGLPPAAAEAGTSRPQSHVPDIWAAEVTVQERALRHYRDRNENSVTGYNFVYAISSGVLPTLSNGSLSVSDIISSTFARSNSVASSRPSDSPPRPSTSSNRSTSTSDASPALPRQENNFAQLLNNPPPLPVNKRIFQNAKKLTYYIRETTSGKGYIKEPSFSMDGRVICSPHDNGLRLLAYDEGCPEYPRDCSNIENRAPKKLTEIKYNRCHSDLILCTKFSPTQPLLVTGCRRGKILWHHAHW